jgi:hypothetical protein
MPRSSKCCLSFRSRHHNPVKYSPISHVCHMPSPSRERLNRVVFSRSFREVSNPPETSDNLTNN